MSHSPQIARLEASITIQLTAPLHIGSGEEESGSDSGIVRDFNGLPGVPGASTQGVLAEGFETLFGSEEMQRLFGRQSLEDVEDDNGKGGRVWLGWGSVHNQNDVPVIGRLRIADRDADPVLRDAARPMLRDHVRTTHRGVMEKGGKFDEHVVSAGHRITFVMRFDTADADPDLDDWQRLLALLHDPALRLGGKSRRGCGAFEVLKIQPAAGTPPFSRPPNFPALPWQHHILRITPENLWMFGGGWSEEADSAPIRTKRIEWSDSSEPKGTTGDVWLIPGSGVKGPLVHRVCFHANRRAGVYADEISPERVEDVTGQNRIAESLFGFIRGEDAQAGLVLFGDAFLPVSGGPKESFRQHVKIDPFLGGASDTALFNDAPLAGGGYIEIPISIAARADETARECLAAAIADLNEGLLPLGAHAGRGYGHFSAKMEVKP